MSGLRRIWQTLRRDEGHQVFLAMCQAHGLPAPVPEHRFCERKWRLDWAWLAPHCVALEVEGGVYTGGRHTRGKGFIADIEKYNAATVMGWRVFRATPQQVKSGEIFSILKEAFDVPCWASSERTTYGR